MELERQEEISQEIISECTHLAYTRKSLTDRDKARLSALIHEYLDEVYQAGQLDKPVSPFSTFNAGSLPYTPIDTSAIDDLNI